MENVIETLGKIKVVSSKIVASDPCYELDIWCASVIDGVLNGNYNAYIETSNEGEWGKRVAKLRIIHEEYDGKVIPTEYDTSCAVDGGTFCFADHDYYAKHHENNLDEEWYDENVCDMCDEDGWMVDDACAISSSGFGDGMYEVYIGREKNGYVVCAEVIFIDDEEEDEWDEEDDDECLGFHEEWED